ncbi:MAG: transporter substrate-binding domain-containing protein [Usitatibacter sp.]
MKELAPAGALRIAVFTGNPVIGRRDPATGEITGTTVTLGRELAAQAAVPAAIIEYKSVAKIVEDARSGVWDVAVIAIDPARRNSVDYTGPHIIAENTLLVAPGSTMRSMADADRPGVRIAAARGGAPGMILERMLKNARVVTTETEAAAFDLLREGKAEAYAQNRFLLLGQAEQLPGSRVLDDSFAAIEVAFALPKGRPEALAYVSDFVERSKQSGAVLRAIQAAELRGVRVAPAAR